MEIESTASEIRTSVWKGPSQPIAFGWAEHSADVTFRRTWHHIRSNRVSLRLFHFVVQGEHRLVQGGGSYVIRPGQCAVINSDEPFYSHALIGANGTFESAYAAVPEHMVLSRMPWAMHVRTPLQIGPSHRHLVGKLLDLLWLEGSTPGSRTAALLAEAFLECVSESVRTSVKNHKPPIGLVDRRFLDIQQCIDRYLTCADLTAERVAQYCGISTRYLCHLLRSKETSYSDLLWQKRLGKSREWLVSAAFKNCSIVRIASMAGFKSASHFSRLFKDTYGVSPKGYRTEYMKAQ
jgi:AraC-like DNA-binding protein